MTSDSTKSSALDKNFNLEGSTKLLSQEARDWKREREQTLNKIKC